MSSSSLTSDTDSRMLKHIILILQVAIGKQKVQKKNVLEFSCFNDFKETILTYESFTTFKKKVWLSTHISEKQRSQYLNANYTRQISLQHHVIRNFGSRQNIFCCLGVFQPQITRFILLLFFWHFDISFGMTCCYF